MHIKMLVGMWALVFVVASVNAWAHEGPEACDGTQEARQESERMSVRIRQSSNKSMYSCDLRAQFNQCRQYMVGSVDDKSRINELALSCQSLGGAFARGACPETGRLATCASVRVRKDVFYDASYYPGEPSQWSGEHLREVCQNLPGQFNQPE